MQREKWGGEKRELEILNAREEEKKEITGKICMVSTQKYMNTLPTQQGWTAEGKVIPISDRHLSCATSPTHTYTHTHFTLVCHKHKPTAMRNTHWFLFHCVRDAAMNTCIHWGNLQTYVKPVPLYSIHHLVSLFLPSLCLCFFTSPRVLARTAARTL